MQHTDKKILNANGITIFPLKNSLTVSFPRNYDIFRFILARGGQEGTIDILFSINNMIWHLITKKKKDKYFIITSTALKMSHPPKLGNSNGSVQYELIGKTDSELRGIKLLPNIDKLHNFVLDAAASRVFFRKGRVCAEIRFTRLPNWLAPKFKTFAPDTHCSAKKKNA